VLTASAVAGRLAVLDGEISDGETFGRETFGRETFGCETFGGEPFDRETFDGAAPLVSVPGDSSGVASLDEA